MLGPVWSSQAQHKRATIVIDPGHGGIDSGALGINDIKEKDITLELAKRIVRLNLNKNDLNIYLTRFRDTLISLKDRSRLTAAIKPDLFISLHLNYSPNSTARGLEVFVLRGEMSKNLRESIFVANEIHSALTSHLGIKSRGIKFAGFQVLKESLSIAPSILVELGFLSNLDEADFISKSENLEVIALLIYDKLLNLFEQ